MSNLVRNPEDRFCHEEAHILCLCLLTDCLFTGSRLGGSYLDGTTRSDLLRALETSTDTESLASTGKERHYSNLSYNIAVKYLITLFTKNRMITRYRT